MLLIGFTDKNRKFHPTGVCVPTNEKTPNFESMFRSVEIVIAMIFVTRLKLNILIAEAADSNEIGFKRVFGEAIKMVKNISKHVRIYVRSG